MPLSGSVSGGYFYPGLNKPNSPFPYLVTSDLRTSSGHLVLSSSSGVVALSGTAKFGRYTFASLPAGSDTLSGSVVWVSDRKCFAMYGPEGWQRLTSGTL